MMTDPLPTIRPPSTMVYLGEAKVDLEDMIRYLDDCAQAYGAVGNLWGAAALAEVASELDESSRRAGVPRRPITGN